jgi:hypothetical protein
MSIVRGSELVVSFWTLAQMREGGLDANWDFEKCDADYRHLDNLQLVSTAAA